MKLLIDANLSPRVADGCKALEPSWWPSKVERPMSTPAIDLRVDFNVEDETGFSWTYLDEGADRSRIVPGRYVVAGVGDAVAVVEVMDVTGDGLVHVRPVRGTVESNRHLLGGPARPSP